MLIASFAQRRIICIYNMHVHNMHNMHDLGAVRFHAFSRKFITSVTNALTFVIRLIFQAELSLFLSVLAKPVQTEFMVS